MAKLSISSTRSLFLPPPPDQESCRPGLGEDNLFYTNTLNCSLGISKLYTTDLDLS